MIGLHMEGVPMHKKPAKTPSLRVFYCACERRQQAIEKKGALTRCV